ncbi:hypothetical protein N665_0087s0006 [Sinapis alba]|nr:hypothetical protein N665_0087s0006 [Sinapis alba]
MSSSSCVSENYYKRRLNTEKETPKQCWCGESSNIFTSGSATNPGRLYFCCAKGYHKRYLFKWTNECLVEEVEDIKSMISGMNKDISELRLNVVPLEKEIEGIKREYERKGDECMSHSRCLRNVFFSGVGMVILCYYFIFV